MSTAPSPLILSGSLVSFTITVNGSVIPSTFQVVSITTQAAANRVPRARLVLFDGSAASATFPISELPLFLPGNNVIISAGYDQDNIVIFAGVIVRQGIEINTTQSSRLIVEMTDKALAMTLDRKNAVYPNSTDSALMTKLIENSSLTANVTATTVTYEDIVQYYASDWDLLLMRAELNGLVVVVDAGTITVAAPDTQSDPVLTLGYGDAILDFQATMDASTQYSSDAIKSSSWDDATQAVVEAGPGSFDIKQQGNVSSTTLSETFGIKNFPLQTAATLDTASLQAWSTAELLRSQLSKIRGRVKFTGSALVKVGNTVLFAGLGDRFNGVAYVSGVEHEIKDGRWLTTVTFGMTWPWFAAEAPHIAAPATSGQLPPVLGLQTGKVKQVATDPNGEFRVQITLPLLGADSAPVWARLATFYASNGYGAVFFPEVGDEVILSFMNNDPRSPIILGSVYSKTLAPTYPPEQENNKKAVVTRSKLEITFDDDKRILELKTPGNRKITLDDNAGTITLSDDNKNTVTLSSSGIALDSASNMTLSAKGNITITATGNLTMSATGKASLDGTASTQITSSAALTIRGAIVSIN